MFHTGSSHMQLSHVEEKENKSHNNNLFDLFRDFLLLLLLSLVKIKNSLRDFCLFFIYIYLKRPSKIM